MYHDKPSTRINYTRHHTSLLLAILDGIARTFLFHYVSIETPRWSLSTPSRRYDVH
nr:MAG TPA: hypothetical protein [Bacteriophage sp.]